MKDEALTRCVFRITGRLFLFGAAALPATSNSSQSAAPDAQRGHRLQWWREVPFGMFIHWGLYSSAAGEWQGKPVPETGEWIMNKARIPVADYAELAKQFNPVKFDAERWVRLAAEGGMKYIVITAKHHDGFACMIRRPAPTTSWTRRPSTVTP